MSDEKMTGKERIQSRLSRVEGQIRGIKKMVDEDRKCIELLRVTAAANAALRSVAMLIVSEHMTTCFDTARQHPEERQELIRDILEAFSLFK